MPLVKVEQVCIRCKGSELYAKKRLCELNLIMWFATSTYSSFPYC